MKWKEKRTEIAAYLKRMNSINMPIWTWGNSTDFDIENINITHLYISEITDRIKLLSAY